MQRSNVIKRAVKAIIFVVIFLFLMSVLNMTFELNENATEDMLSRYSHTEDIDTVFVGNSAGEMMDAGRFSEMTGTHAFNMCTPSQGLYISLRNIKLACSMHKIRRVVLLFTFDTVNTENYAEVDHLYNRVVNSASPLHVRIMNEVKYNTYKYVTSGTMDTEESINMWIPWEVEHIHGFSNVISNIKKRWI